MKLLIDLPDLMVQQLLNIPDALHSGLEEYTRKVLNDNIKARNETPGTERARACATGRMLGLALALTHESGPYSVDKLFDAAKLGCDWETLTGAEQLLYEKQFLYAVYVHQAVARPGDSFIEPLAHCNAFYKTTVKEFKE